MVSLEVVAEHAHDEKLSNKHKVRVRNFVRMMKFLIFFFRQRKAADGI